MEGQIGEARTLLEALLKEIFENAKDLGNRYLQEVMDANRGKKWKDKNTLQFRVRQRGNALALEWYFIKWEDTKKDGRVMVRDYIRKRNKSARRDAQVYCYNMNDLLRHTSGWDNDLVKEVEAEAAQYRRQAHYIADMLTTLSRLERFMAGVEQEAEIERPA
jgi:hypothetical protein